MELTTEAAAREPEPDVAVPQEKAEEATGDKAAPLAAAESASSSDEELPPAPANTPEPETREVGAQTEAPEKRPRGIIPPCGVRMTALQRARRRYMSGRQCTLCGTNFPEEEPVEVVYRVAVEKAELLLKEEKEKQKKKEEEQLKEEITVL